MIDLGAIVRHAGERGGIYRVQAVDLEARTADVFGGPRRQARTFPLEKLRPATAGEAHRFEETRRRELAALRGIRPARALR